MPNLTDDTPLRLQEAAKLAFPMGNMKPSGLRREIERGNLPASMVAGRYFVTLSDIREMMNRCRVQKHRPDCGSDQQPTTAPPSGSSRTANIERARASAQARLDKLRQFS